MSDSDGSDVAGVVDHTVEYDVGVKTEVPGTGGQLHKTVLVAGNGATPPDGAKVKVHYVGKLGGDGTIFDSSRERGEPFEFSLGEGQVIKGWDKGVVTMRVGEKSVLHCEPEYGYGARGSPPKIPANASLDFEVELLDWTKEEDVSEARDGTIMKQIEKAGSGHDHAEYESSVCISVTVTVEGQRTMEKKEWRLTIGEVDLPVGLERVVTSMKKGECCVATVLGRAVGESDEVHGVVAQRDVVYGVTMHEFDVVRTWDYKGAAKVEQATRRKEEGNGYFRCGSWAKAVRKYRRGLEFVEYDYGLEGEEKAMAAKVKVALQSNLAQSLLMVGEYREVVKTCEKALEVEGSNVKLLFRRGKALVQMDEWEGAKRDFRRVLEVEPGNVEAGLALAEVEAKERRYDAAMKQRFSKLFA